MMWKRMLLVTGSIVLLQVAALAQARLVLNGAKVRISGGAALVIDNAAPEAITRYDGHIISEGAQNSIRWMVRTAAGRYTVPWGADANTYIPVAFEKSAGSGEGALVLSTYGTGWHNSEALPAGVTNFTGPGSDLSARAVDRFWQLQPQGYTIKPDLYNLQMTYRPQEYAEPNTIVETGLRARRWNEATGSWTDKSWSGVVDGVAHSITLPAVSGEDLFAWWTLTDESLYVLPITGLMFEARPKGEEVWLQWKTLTEENNLRFTIERSGNGVTFSPIGSLPGRGTTGEPSTYSYVDKQPLAGESYYRLRQTDTGGKTSYSAVRRVVLEKHEAVVLAPNPARGSTWLYATTERPEKLSVVVLDYSGKVVVRQHVVASRSVAARVDLSACLPGLYFVRVEGSNTRAFIKLLVN